MNRDSLSIEQHGGRTSRKRTKTRADLLAAARQIFAAQGYHDATIAQITQLADLGVGTFYLHFQDKQEIFMTLLEEGIGEIRTEVTTAIEHQPLEQLLPTALGTIFRQAFARREMFQIALSDGGHVLHARIHSARVELAEGITGGLVEAQGRGLLDGYEIPLLARFITGMVFQAISWWFEHDEPSPETMTDQVLRLLRHGLPAQLLAEPVETSK
jgi:AcrR family transcriptional regulator